MTHLDLKNITLKFPGIFTMREGPFGSKAKYNTAFQYNGEELRGEGVLRKGELELYNARSTIPTTILPKDKTYKSFKRLAEFLDTAERCNVSLDRLLRDVEVDARIYIYSYEYQERRGKGICLEEIYVDVKALEKKLIEGEKKDETQNSDDGA